MAFFDFIKIHQIKILWHFGGRPWHPSTGRGKSGGKLKGALTNFIPKSECECKLKSIFGRNIRRIKPSQICFGLNLKTKTPFFMMNPLLYHKLGNMVIFRTGNLYSLCCPGNQYYQKIIYCLIFSSKRNRQCKNCISWYIFDYWTLVANFNLSWWNNKLFSDSGGFLGYKLNISFPVQKLPYSQIYGIKVGDPFKKRRQRTVKHWR